VQYSETEKRILGPKFRSAVEGRGGPDSQFGVHTSFTPERTESSSYNVQRSINDRRLSNVRRRSSLVNRLQILFLSSHMNDVCRSALSDTE